MFSTNRPRPGRLLLPLSLALLAAFGILIYLQKRHIEAPRFTPDEGLLAELQGARILEDPPLPSEAGWPQWRGPRRDGVAAAKNLLTTWPEKGPKRLWHRPAGDSYSSFAVENGRLYTLIRENDREAVVCWKAGSGEEIWRHAYECECKFEFGPGPRGTPTLDGGKLYTVGGGGMFHCLDAATGEVLWKHDLQAEFPAPKLKWGMAYSPLLEGDLVFVMPGMPRGGSLAAFHKGTGELAWKSQDDLAGYASPVAITVNGIKQVLFFTAIALVGVNAENGDLLWRHPWETSFKVNVATPLAFRAESGGQMLHYVFISSGYDRGCCLLKIERAGANGDFLARRVYEGNQMRNHFSTSVRHRDHLYGFDEANLSCLALKSGEIVWKQPGFKKGTLLRADGHLIVLGENGKLALVEATPEEYREKAIFRAFRCDRCWTMPVLAEGLLFARDLEVAACFDLRGPLSFWFSWGGVSFMGFLGWLLRKLFGIAEPRSFTDEPPASRPIPVPRPRAAGPALEASDFLPIGRDELKRGAQSNRGWGNPWFGRRDVIPPASDERTRLIDRGLVTEGLLTPEQLAEIHTVGAEMERLRPTLAAVAQQGALAGEAAVQADKERRAALKKQKKEEAAERKRRRADEIAQRKATDIVFLGRGVSGRLGERQCDAARLAALGLPMLGSPAEVAAALRLSIPKLRWLAFHTEAATRVHYVRFTVPKKGGGTRTLSAPHRTLATAQRWIFENIVSKLPVEAPAHGFLPGRSTLTNAQPHVRRKIVVNMDLEGFFPAIAFPRVRSVFQRLGYSPAAATLLALLCTECPRRTVHYDGKTYHVATGPRALPQGACTSPGLSNQVARRLDKRLHGLAARLGLTYTRYADDLTFSGDESLQGRVGYVMARVRHIAREEGFTVNEKKSRVLRRNNAQRVTGLVVNDRPGVGRKEVRRLRAILHRAKYEGLDRQNREGRQNFLAWLRGKIAYVSMVRPEEGRKLKERLNALTRPGS